MPGVDHAVGGASPELLGLMPFCIGEEAGVKFLAASAGCVRLFCACISDIAASGAGDWGDICLESRFNDLQVELFDVQGGVATIEDQSMQYIIFCDLTDQGVGTLSSTP